MAVLWVALGGALGALSRFGVTTLLSSSDVEKQFPLATMIVNLCGCFLLGFIATYIAKALPEQYAGQMQSFLCVGFLGSLTTFSTFAYQSNWLMSHNPLLAALNIGINVALGMLLAMAGTSLASALIKN